MLAPPPAFADSWLCVGEAAAGFNNSNVPGIYEGVGFSMGSNILVRPRLPDDVEVKNYFGNPQTYTAFYIGNPEPIGHFYGDLAGNNDPGTFFISDSGRAQLTINVNIGRYVLVSYFDYVARVDNEYRPFIEVGKCTQLD